MANSKLNGSAVSIVLSCFSIALLCVVILRSEYRHYGLDKRVFKLEENYINNHHQDIKKKEIVSDIDYSGPVRSSSSPASRERRQIHYANNTDTLPPNNTGTLPPNNTGTLPPNNTGILPPYNTGTLPPYNTGTLPPYNTGTLPPKTTGTLPPNNIGTLPPNNTGTLPPYNAGTFPHSYVKNEVRRVIGSLLNLFCAKEQKLCLQGEKGEKGTAGVKGHEGKKGNSGQKGDEGRRGRTGKRGPKGENGDKGLPGRNGPQGQKGDPGISISPPSILVGPKSVSVLRHSNVSFSCNASGLPVPNIKWSGESGLGANHVVQGKTLWLVNTTIADDGVYTCTASSVLGSVRKSAVLTVQVPVQIITHPKPTVIEEGRRLRLLCQATGNPPPQITWKRLSGSLNPSRVIISGGSLTIKSTILTDAGIYVCVAKNLLNVQTTKASVLVIPRLRFTLTPASKNIRLLYRATLRLDCQATSGSFNPQITWARDPPDGKSLNVLTNGTLVKHGVERKDSGVYVCTAKNIVAQISTRVSVYVLLPRTCSELKTFGTSSKSGYAMIDPDGNGGVPPFRVYCDMQDKNQVGVTVISHNSEKRTLVQGYENTGSYTRNVTYNEVTTSQLAKLTRVSSQCEQFIKYECHGSYLGDGWWVSCDGAKMVNWGGVPTGVNKCACGMTNTCTNNKHCNCNVNDHVWRQDSGFLTDKSRLPVSQLRFGDTGETGEKGYHTLGKLKCFG